MQLHPCFSLENMDGIGAALLKVVQCRGTLHACRFTPLLALQNTAHELHGLHNPDSIPIALQLHPAGQFHYLNCRVPAKVSCC